MEPVSLRTGPPSFLQTLVLALQRYAYCSLWDWRLQSACEISYSSLSSICQLWATAMAMQMVRRLGCTIHNDRIQAYPKGPSTQRKGIQDFYIRNRKYGILSIYLIVEYSDP